MAVLLQFCDVLANITNNYQEQLQPAKVSLETYEGCSKASPLEFSPDELLEHYCLCPKDHTQGLGPRTYLSEPVNLMARLSRAAVLRLGCSAIRIGCRLLAGITLLGQSKSRRPRPFIIAQRRDSCSDGPPSCSDGRPDGRPSSGTGVRLWAEEGAIANEAAAESAATSIQAHFRGWRQRGIHLAKVAAAKGLQRRTAAAICIQARFRGWRQRRDYLAAVAAVRDLQALARCWLARRQMAAARAAIATAASTPQRVPSKGRHQPKQQGKAKKSRPKVARDRQFAERALAGHRASCEAAARGAATLALVEGQ